jgi:hypothetical protein
MIAGAHTILAAHDVAAARAGLETRGVELVAAISDEGLGRLTRLRVPGYGELGLHEPRHPSPLAEFG